LKNQIIVVFRKKIDLVELFQYINFFEFKKIKKISYLKFFLFFIKIDEQYMIDMKKLFQQVYKSYITS